MSEHEAPAFGFDTLVRMRGGPHAFYVTGEDHLVVTSLNALAGVVLSVRGRFFDPVRGIQSLTFLHTPNSNRTLATTRHPLGAGWLLNFDVAATTGSPLIGQTFVRVGVQRGETAAGVALGTLAQGYVTDTQPLAWPGSRVRSSVEGPGVIRSIAGTDAAAGTELSQTVPTGARWRLRSLIATLVTEGAPANREVALVFDDGTTVYQRVPSGVTHIASETRRYTAHPSAARLTAAQDLTHPLPIGDLILLAGHRVRTITTNLQALDDWGAPQLLVEEWQED